MKSSTARVYFVGMSLATLIIIAALLLKGDVRAAAKFVGGGEFTIEVKDRVSK